MVHVPSHSRQRQVVVTVMTFARVSMIRPLQNGHTVGRATVSLDRESGMSLFLFLNTRHRERMGRPAEQADPNAGGSLIRRLFKSEQPSPVGSPRIEPPPGMKRGSPSSRKISPGLGRNSCRLVANLHYQFEDHLNNTSFTYRAHAGEPGHGPAASMRDWCATRPGPTRQVTRPISASSPEDLHMSYQRHDQAHHGQGLRLHRHA